MGKSLELIIEWPEKEVGGLHFKGGKTKGVFEIKEDGKYYSRDILFLSARNSINNIERDVLSEYLALPEVSAAFEKDLEKAGIKGNVKAFLPNEEEGGKTYNGEGFCYWLKNVYYFEEAFICVDEKGVAFGGSAETVGGCAPAFSIT